MHYRLAYQMSRVTRERGCLPHDDKLEALAMAVGYWVEHLSRSIEDVQAERLDEEFQAIHDEWEEATGAYSTDNWNDGTIPEGML